MEHLKIGISSTNYSDSLISTNFSLLTEEGNSSNINDVGNVYFKNFESVYTGDANDTFYIDGPVNDLNYIDGKRKRYFFLDVFKLQTILASMLVMVMIE